LNKSGVRVLPEEPFRWKLTPRLSADPTEVYWHPSTIEDAASELRKMIAPQARAILQESVRASWSRKKRLGKTSKELAHDVLLEFEVRAENAVPDHGSYLAAVLGWVSSEWLSNGDPRPLPYVSSSASSLVVQFREIGVVTRESISLGLLSVLAHRIVGQSDSPSSILSTFVLHDKPYKVPSKFVVQGCKEPLKPLSPFIWTESAGVDGGVMVFHVAECPEDRAVWFFHEAFGWFVPFGPIRRYFWHAHNSAGVAMCE
jgi:hypothetical protein